ncbi:TniQ family protein [Streptomyces sp. NBC_01478]|uniref:hypothetical protein n=1 Tax=Streptomyces sp. NBC_01478 TaxID=2903882 RepID=UPI002E33E15B|nr:hypothetical protein [Streptomyces sp. NBC_01478]
MTTPFRPVIFRPLPRSLPPFPNETLQSYCQRLAHANRIPAERLHTPSLWLAHDGDSVTALLRRLTILTGLSRETFWHALPELRWRHEHGMSPLGRSLPPVVSMRLRPRWACRRCTATRTPGQHVMTWVPIYTHICLQHRLWIGEAVAVTREQVDLAQMPGALWAQRRHHRLVRRHGERVTAECFRTGGALWKLFAAHHYTLVPEALGQGLAKPRGPYLSWGPQLYAAAYPAAVTMMSLVASPAWRSLLAESMFPSDVDRFMKEFTRRLPPSHPAYATNMPALPSKTGAMVRRVTQILRETKAA